VAVGDLVGNRDQQWAGEQVRARLPVGAGRALSKVTRNGFARRHAGGLIFFIEFALITDVWATSRGTKVLGRLARTGAVVMRDGMAA
jgi:hypothetical protein